MSRREDDISTGIELTVAGSAELKPYSSTDVECESFHVDTVLI